MSGKENGFIWRLVERARRRSAWLYHFNAGACNGCDIELVTCLSPRYDVEQIGIKLEGSPRHADVLCVSGTGDAYDSRGAGNNLWADAGTEGRRGHRFLPGDMQRICRQPGD